MATRVAGNHRHAENPSASDPKKPAEIGRPDRPLVPMPKPLVFCIGGKQANLIGLAEPIWAAKYAPSASRRHFRPFIEDVDDRLPDLIQEWNSCQTKPLDKGTFF